jgi:hypothetical protein
LTDTYHGCPSFPYSPDPDSPDFFLSGIRYRPTES